MEFSLGVCYYGCSRRCVVKTIRELREERSWTQLELAVKLEVTPSTVYNWERGKNEPTASKLRQMARLFDVPMETIALPEDMGKAAA